MKHIPIYFAFDNNYVVPAAVAFFSLLNKAKKDIFYDMFVLHENIEIKNQKSLNDIVENLGNGKLTFFNVENSFSKEWETGNFDGHNRRNQFTKETLIKCLASKLFLQYEKIIYSDVDILVSEDISELIDVNLDKKYIAAVKDAFLKWDNNELSHLSSENYEKFKNTYFAGGIWVMNLKKIREDNLETRIIEIIKDDKIVKRWPDQDIMNIACDNKVEFLPLNYIAYPYLHERVLLTDFKSDYSRNELFDSIINPKIIHYAGVKPWNNTPKFSENWNVIYNYLDLKNKFPKFKLNFNKNSKDKKIKKYKKLFNIFLAFSIFLFVTLILFYIGVLIK